MKITKNKTWALAFLTALASFVAVNFAVWKGFTAEMLNGGEYVTPDLVRLGYVVGSTLYRKAESTLPKKHIESREYSGQHIDLLTIGDSFSNMNGQGLDPMYQDWLASVGNISVMNAPILTGMDGLSTLIVLMNSGYIDKIRPRAVLLECVERHAVNELGRKVDFDLSRSREEVEEFYKRPEREQKPPKVGFINKSNFKFLAYSILYHFSPNAYFSQVYIKDMSSSLFSVPRDKRLLFWFEDLKTIRAADARTVSLLNENMNSIALKLKKKGIKFYFMPAANKYTVYSDYIVNNTFPASTFFELLRPLPKQYAFVDTESILTEEVKKGEKDVYYPDETHWSWKAAKKIAESIKL